MGLEGTNVQQGPSDLRYLSLAKYDHENDLGRESLAPAVPALYMWVFDFISLVGYPEHLVQEALSRFHDQDGTRWPLNAGLFDNGEFRTSRPVLSNERQEIISREISQATPLGTTIANIATFQQRPLYCGITVNFRRRLTEHVNEKTPFSNRLTSIGLGECAVLWAEVASPNVSAMTIDPENQDFLSEEFLSPADCSEADDDPLATDDEYLAKNDPKLRAFESLVIRTSMPTMNRALDS